jgi:hypothetical protein
MNKRETSEQKEKGRRKIYKNFVDLFGQVLLNLLSLGVENLIVEMINLYFGVIYFS